jgi:hypothetical protein
MLGWLTVFAGLMIGSLTILLTDTDATAPALLASLLFAFLFLACLLTRAVRGRV